MNTALAQLLTTALVQFIDKNQPKDKMCVSSIEAEELERCFTEEKFNRVEDWYANRMKPELTEFEQALSNYLKNDFEYFHTKKWDEQKWNDVIRTQSKELLSLAKKELLSYVDESNPAIEAMADLERAVTCGNVDNIPKWLQEELNKAFKKGQESSHEDYIRGYTNGYKDAEENYNKSVAYHLDIPDNWPPKMPDLPTYATTNSGTSSCVARGNTSVTDGKEHNPSFTD
jgi:hypothetical protein